MVRAIASSRIDRPHFSIPSVLQTHKLPLITPSVASLPKPLPADMFPEHLHPGGSLFRRPLALFRAALDTIEPRLRAAGFGEACRIEDFDWSARITRDSRVQYAVFSPRFPRKHNHVLPVGAAGVGKSFIIQASAKPPHVRARRLYASSRYLFQGQAPSQSGQLRGPNFTYLPPTAGELDPFQQGLDGASPRDNKMMGLKRRRLLPVARQDTGACMLYCALCCIGTPGSRENIPSYTP